VDVDRDRRTRVGDFAHIDAEGDETKDAGGEDCASGGHEMVLFKDRTS
jgi:hypothetical protein